MCATDELGMDSIRGFDRLGYEFGSESGSECERVRALIQIGAHQTSVPFVLVIRASFLC